MNIFLRINHYNEREREKKKINTVTESQQVIALSVSHPKKVQHVFFMLVS